MRKVISLSIITTMLLSAFVFIQADAYEHNNSYSSTKGKLTPRVTRAEKRRQAQEEQELQEAQIQDFAAASKIDYTVNNYYTTIRPQRFKNTYRGHGARPVKSNR